MATWKIHENVTVVPYAALTVTLRNRNESFSFSLSSKAMNHPVVDKDVKIFNLLSKCFFSHILHNFEVILLVEFANWNLSFKALGKKPQTFHLKIIKETGLFSQNFF